EAGLRKICFKRRLFSIALPSVDARVDITPKESKMESKFMKINGVGHRYKRWEGKDIKPFGSWCKKLREAGACFCTLCWRKLIYATSSPTHNAFTGSNIHNRCTVIKIGR